jgi:hypothetical protein
VVRAHELLALGVNCSLSTNNVLNPFTPFGDCSLLRQAGLYANVAHVGTRQDMRACFELVTTPWERRTPFAGGSIVRGLTFRTAYRCAMVAFRAWQRP